MKESMTHLHFYSFCSLIVTCLLISNTVASANTLDLHEAIQRTLIYSPAVAVANSGVDIKNAEEYQVGLYPNPQIDVEIEGANTLMSKKKGSKDSREITYSLSQLIELGGKRSLRKQIAAFQSSLAIYDVEIAKLDIYNNVTKAFIEVVAAQENVKLAEEQKRIAQEIYTTTSVKVQSGKISSFQEKKANIALINADLSLQKTYRIFELSKKKLSALWGSCFPEFTQVDYPLFEITSLMDLAVLIAEQNNNLEVLKWNLQIAMAEKIIESEIAQRIPDVVLTAGYVDCEVEGSGLLLGFSMPIPVFDRNQGNICRAKKLLNQIYEEKKESMIQMRIDLEESYDQLFNAYKEGLAFKETILSSAKAAFEAAKEEYTRGKIDYLELLDAQRLYFEVQEQYIHTLVEYHQNKSDVNRLIGGLDNTCIFLKSY